MRIVMLWSLLVLMTGLAAVMAFVVNPLMRLVVQARRCADWAEVGYLLAVLERKLRGRRKNSR